MISQFLKLEWKQFFRSSHFQKGIVIKIFLFLGVLYFGGIALFLGGSTFFIIKKSLPEADPLIIVNNYIIFWFLLSLILRYFLQQLPVLNIKPLMTIPIKRNFVIHYLLGKTIISFFNLLPILFFLPFAVVLLIKGYPVVHVIFWFLSMKFIVLSINFINFLINKNNIAFYIILTVLVALIGLEYYQVFKISKFIGFAFNALYTHSYLIFIPLFLLLILYIINFGILSKGFYVDDVVLTKKIKEVHATDLSWMDRFGAMAPFLKNDVKLIWRNARPKQVVKMSFIFLFYGLIFYTSKTYKDMPVFLAFASIFVTGGFLLSFGQLVPSWDSEYYKMLMSQNIPYKQYLESKWTLMVTAVAISFVLSTPYLYFGWKIFGMITAGAFFNIGLNSFITLFGGALNRVPIELNVKAKAFSNTNGFNLTQLLIGLPKMILPMLFFYIPYKFINFEAGIITLGLIGLLGIVLKDFFLNNIEKVYQKGKYKTIAAFNEKS